MRIGRKSSLEAPVGEDGKSQLADFIEGKDYADTSKEVDIFFNHERGEKYKKCKAFFLLNSKCCFHSVQGFFQLGDSLFTVSCAVQNKAVPITGHGIVWLFIDRRLEIDQRYIHVAVHGC